MQNLFDVGDTVDEAGRFQNEHSRPVLTLLHGLSSQGWKANANSSVEIEIDLQRGFFWVINSLLPLHRRVATVLTVL